MIGERLKSWREGEGLTLDDLALKTGIPKSNLSYYETKGKSLPQEAIEKLKGVGAPVTWIISGEKPAASQEPWEGSISREVFDAIQRAGQMMENTMRAVPPDLREGIDTRQMGFVLAQMVDDLVGGDQERIVESLGKFLASIPRRAPKP